MGLDHLLLLAAIQGITEFIPVSSSGHLQLVHGLTAYPDHGLVIDVALHAGTLFAVMAYFRRDVGLMLVGARDIIRRQPSAAARLVQVLLGQLEELHPLSDGVSVDGFLLSLVDLVQVSQPCSGEGVWARVFVEVVHEHDDRNADPGHPGGVDVLDLDDSALAFEEPLGVCEIAEQGFVAALFDDDE